MKSYKNIIIISILLIILVMAIGYSTFATGLTINHTAEIVSEWDIRITNVKVQFASENCNPGTPEYTNTTVTLDSKLTKPGDTIIYEITIKNEGNIDATLGNLIFKEEEGSPAIKFETSKINDSLSSGEETKLLITVKYDSEFEGIPEIKTKSLTGIIEYIQK